MKTVLAAIVIFLFTSCSQKQEYSEFVRPDGKRDRDGWDWIVIGDSGQRVETGRIVELLKRDAWRIEWFGSSTSFRNRDPKAKGRLAGMRSILLAGDAVGSLRELEVAPRDLVLLLPTGEPPAFDQRFRPWRLVLVLDAERRAADSDAWLNWAKERNVVAVKFAKGEIGSEQVWARILAEMGDGTTVPNGL